MSTLRQKANTFFGGRPVGGQFASRTNDEAIIDPTSFGDLETPRLFGPEQLDGALREINRNIKTIVSSPVWSKANRQRRAIFEGALADQLNRSLLFAIATDPRIKVPGVGRCVRCGRFERLSAEAHACPADRIRDEGGLSDADAVRLAQAGFTTVGAVRAWSPAIDRLGPELAGFTMRAGWGGPWAALEWANRAAEPGEDLIDNPRLLKFAHDDAVRVEREASRISNPKTAHLHGEQVAELMDQAVTAALAAASRSTNNVIGDPESFAQEAASKVVRAVLDGRFILGEDLNEQVRKMATVATRNLIRDAARGQTADGQKVQFVSLDDANQEGLSAEVEMAVHNNGGSFASPSVLDEMDEESERIASALVASRDGRGRGGIPSTDRRLQWSFLVNNVARFGDEQLPEIAQLSPSQVKQVRRLVADTGRVSDVAEVALRLSQMVSRSNRKPSAAQAMFPSITEHQVEVMRWIEDSLEDDPDELAEFQRIVLASSRVAEVAV